jgi:hypothetical protein
MNWSFLKNPAFWAAIGAAVTIIVATIKPELRATLEELMPLLVTIIVAIFGGVIADKVGNAYVRAQYAKAGRVLPDEHKKVA